MSALPRAGYAHVNEFNPTKVRRRGNAHEVFGVSPSLLTWRDKRQEGKCRMCLRTADVRPLTRHHVVPLAFFARRSRPHLVRNVSANIVPLCRRCHDLVETDMGIRREFRKVLAPDEVTFILQIAGRAWFDRYYPA